MQTFTIKLPDDLHERLKNAALDASRNGPRVSMAELARAALEAYLKEENKNGVARLLDAREADATREKSLDT